MPIFKNKGNTPNYGTNRDGLVKVDRYFRMVKRRAQETAKPVDLIVREIIYPISSDWMRLMTVKYIGFLHADSSRTKDVLEYLEGFFGDDKSWKGEPCPGMIFVPDSSEKDGWGLDEIGEPKHGFWGRTLDKSANIWTGYTYNVTNITLGDEGKSTNPPTPTLVSQGEATEESSDKPPTKTQTKSRGKRFRTLSNGL